MIIFKATNIQFFEKAASTAPIGPITNTKYQRGLEISNSILGTQSKIQIIKQTKDIMFNVFLWLII